MLYPGEKVRVKSAEKLKLYGHEEENYPPEYFDFCEKAVTISKIVPPLDSDDEISTYCIEESSDLNDLWLEESFEPLNSPSEITNYSSIADTFRGKVIRYWVERRGFTPYEQNEKFIDDTMFEGEEASFGRIVSTTILPDKDVLLGIKTDDSSENDIHYHKLSKIEICVYEEDQVEDEDYENGTD
jgi:hypothetical protein